MKISILVIGCNVYAVLLIILDNKKALNSTKCEARRTIAALGRIKGCLFKVHFYARLHSWSRDTGNLPFPSVLSMRGCDLSSQVLEQRELRRLTLHPCDTSGEIIGIKLAARQVNAAVMRGDA